MKNIIALIMAMTMALSLISCGKNNPTPDQSVATTGDEVLAVESATASPTSGSNAGEITEDNLRSFPATDESQFDVTAVDDGVYIYDCFSDDPVIVVPDTIDGKPVVGIAPSSLSELKAEAVVLPDTVREIGQGAFQMCDNLRYIDLGTGLKSIDSMAFGNCEKLIKVEFPDGMEAITDAVFYNCGALEEVIIPASVTSIPGNILSCRTCPKAVVLTPKGSTAEKVCVENNIPFENN